MSDEMGGGETIMGFQLSRADKRLGLDLECSKLRVPARRIIVPGVPLTIPRQTLIANLGPAQADSGGFLHYAHERSLRGPSSSPEIDDWWEWSTLDLEFKGDTLVWLQAWKSTTS